MGLIDSYNLCGALFDLDGVLIDTEGIYSEFWAGVDRLYPTGVPDFTSVIKGSNLAMILGTYFPDADRQARICRMLAEQQAAMRYDLFPGVPELLERLRSRGVRCCLVTSSDDGKMREVWRHQPELRRCFEAVVTGDMVTRPKPDPECFLLGAQAIGCTPEQCVVVEDSLNGLRAGRASGAVVAAVATTCRREIIEPLARITVNQTSHLINLL